MRLAPLSSDLMIELAIAGGVLLGAVLLARAASNAAANAAGQAWDATKQGAWAITPWNQDNVIYGGVNSVGGAIVTDPAGPGKNADGSWSLGGWVYDVTHPETAAAVRNVGNTGGATGSW